MSITVFCNTAVDTSLP